MIELRDNGTIPLRDPVSGELNWVDERTEAIVTYALCGFANFGSIGIMLGGLGKQSNSLSQLSAIFFFLLLKICVDVLSQSGM